MGLDLVGINMLFIKRKCGIGKVREVAKMMNEELERESGQYPEWILKEKDVDDLKAAWDTNLTIRNMMRESLPSERRLVKIIVKRDKAKMNIIKE